MSNRELFEEIENSKTEMVETLMALVRIPAVGPENGGEGESKKAQKVAQLLGEVGFDEIQRIDAEDPRVPGGSRPNFVAYIRGDIDQKIWIITHMDVVPAGDSDLWTVAQPFEPILKDNRVYGRGAEDNGQSLVASVYAVKAIKRSGLKPKRTVALAIVSDEEQGNTMGIQHLIKNGIFKKDDLILVPDGGSEDGSFIEVAEKSILWFKLHTIGKQSHASLPNKGINAHRIGMQVSLALDSMLHEKYALKDEKYDVPESTFEITKKDRNVEAVNIIPGEDTIYFDCRILPDYDVDGVLSEIMKVITIVEKNTGAKINLEVLQKQVSKDSKSADSDIVTHLKNALKEARGIDTRVGGLGGGTCAAFFRKAGFPAVVWSTVDEVAHQSNEYSKVQNMVDDAKIFALLALG